MARDWLGREGLDGIVAKRLDLPYQSGERTMRKFKLWKSADCVVAGLYRKRGTQAVEHLLLGLYDEEGLLNYVGRARIYADAAEIGRLLEPLVGGPGFAGPLAGGQEPLVRSQTDASAAEAGPCRRGQRRSHHGRAHASRGAPSCAGGPTSRRRTARWIRSGDRTEATRRPALKAHLMRRCATTRLRGRGSQSGFAARDGLAPCGSVRARCSHYPGQGGRREGEGQPDVPAIRPVGGVELTGVGMPRNLPPPYGPMSP